MLNDCNYSKVRLLHDLSRIAWYLENHGIKDAEETGHPACEELHEEIQGDPEGHIDRLKETIRKRRRTTRSNDRSILSLSCSGAYPALECKMNDNVYYGATYSVKPSASFTGTATEQS